jgi:hypothetical protein
MTVSRFSMRRRRSSSVLATGLACAIAGCGGAGHTATVRSPPTAYGTPASADDRDAIAQLVERYYADAAADDGAGACSLLYSLVAESIPEDLGQPPGPPSLRGSTCAAVMSKLFRQVPGQPPAVLAATRVSAVRTDGNRGIAMLRSPTMLEGELRVKREHGTWRVGSGRGRGVGGGEGSAQPARQPEGAGRPGPRRVDYGGAPIVKDSNDGDEDPGSDDDAPIRFYGHAASRADRRAIVSVVRLYYKAAAAEHGSLACSSAIYSLIAETLPEGYEGPVAPGQPRTCATAMTRIFSLGHRRYAADLAALRVTGVRVREGKAIVLVFLGGKPDSYVRLHRDGAAWRMQSLSELSMP